MVVTPLLGVMAAAVVNTGSVFSTLTLALALSIPPSLSSATTTAAPPGSSATLVLLNSARDALVAPLEGLLLLYSAFFAALTVFRARNPSWLVVRNEDLIVAPLTTWAAPTTIRRTAAGRPTTVHDTNDPTVPSFSA